MRLEDEKCPKCGNTLIRSEQVSDEWMIICAHCKLATYPYKDFEKAKEEWESFKKGGD